MNELDKKAEDLVKNLRVDLKDNCFLAFKKGYEEGQKDCRFQELKKGNPFFVATELKKENEELKTKLKDLSSNYDDCKCLLDLSNEQIEKMKCCANCANLCFLYCKDIPESNICKECIADKKSNRCNWRLAEWMIKQS